MMVAYALFQAEGLEGGDCCVTDGHGEAYVGKCHVVSFLLWECLSGKGCKHKAGGHAGRPAP
ncbi:hypothetical protein [Prevotella fusca]|uniref:hypothetical protein n=1 Tax=Prevotella fusca TaxID=589436 RepID=UPI001FC9C4D1|nr:hypothetical protein [Prevotella fusca]